MRDFEWIVKLECCLAQSFLKGS